MKKILLIGASFIVIAALAFWAGRTTFKCDNDAGPITEIHFLNPKYVGLGAFSFQHMMKNVLQDSLKKLKPPFTEQRISTVIRNIETQERLPDYLKLIHVSSTDYKIIVSTNDTDYRSNYYLVTRDSVYYLKPLKIVEDLEPRH